MITIGQLLKVVGGFVHAGLQEENGLKIGVVFLSQVGYLGTIVGCRKAFQMKTAFVLILLEYIARIPAHLLLVFRVLYIARISPIVDDTLDELEIAIIYCIFGLAVMQMFVIFRGDEQRKKVMKNN